MNSPWRMLSLGLAKHWQRPFPRKMRWMAACTTAFLLALFSWIDATYFPLTELPKGSVARYTMRASHDTVFDLHETFRAEAEEARLKHLPIYLRDEGLPYSYQMGIIKAALAEPLTTWDFPVSLDSGLDGFASADLGENNRPPFINQPPPSSPDAGISPLPNGSFDAGPLDAPTDALDQGLGPLNEQQLEIEALIRGYFRFLESYYRDGVVGDNEYPKEKESIRILYRGEYNIKPVSSLQRFSKLRYALARQGKQIFVKTDSRVQEQVINFILQRLPPNLTYAKENEKFITDISQVTGVKVVLIRNGEMLIRRGDVVDTRAYHAIRASVRAAELTTRWGREMSKVALLVTLMLLFIIAGQDISPGPFRPLRTYLVIDCGILVIVMTGFFLLHFLPFDPVIVPQATLALIIAVVLGRGPGLLVGITVPCCLVLSQIFDLSALLVGAGGGIAAALAVRRRRRGSALAAGVLVGLSQALIYEACRAIDGRPRTYAELWSAGQAFVGGLMAGLFSIVTLPLVERLLGISSRGKLRALIDFDHPLLRELRERAPGTFAHSVALISLVEAAVEAVGRDRLLSRAGTLYHDVGKIVTPHFFRENQHSGLLPALPQYGPEESAKIIRAHVERGREIAKKYRLPPDVSAFISEHHGTTSLDQFFIQAQEAGAELDPALFCYPGPKPQSIETAILMLADAVEWRFRALLNPDRRAIEEMVDAVIFKRISEFQFDECGISQADLKRIKESFINYLLATIDKEASLFS